MVKALLPAWIFHFAAKKDDEPKPVPDDLSTLSDDDLAALETSLAERAQPLIDDKEIDQAGVDLLVSLAEDLDRVRAEKTTRETQAEELKGQRDAAAARISGADPSNEGTPPARAEAPPTVPAEPAAAAVEPAAVEGEPAPEMVAVTLANGDTYEVPAKIFPADVQVAAAGPRKLNGTKLSDIRRRAPQVLAQNRPDRVLVAAADIPGYTSGGELENLAQVADAMQRRARAMGDSRGALTQVPIASIEKSHGDFELDVRDGEITDLGWETIQQVTDPDVLAAAGGWCAPSEIRYELFNVTCEDGMIDLPTVGITRGGIRWPVSITVADVLNSLWTWTEANDIAADVVSGGPTKPCAHVECVSFSEARLAYEGLCVTAGNLTERSYPELIRNFLTTVMSAHFHRINKSKIDQIVALATAVDVTSPATGAAANVLGALDLQAIDYRAKFGMCLDAILEVVLPDWIEGPIRADFSRRMGLSPEEATISDAVMNRWFDERQIRVQFVNDYQIRATGFPGNGTIAAPNALLAWPATVNFLMYAAGTVLLGDGPTIDLGVVRDSTLNARNDYTAAWSEEGFLIAEVGHEIRNVEVEILPDGTVGAQPTLTGPLV